MCVCVCVCVQAINADLVPYLLELLERDLIDCDKPSATKAIIAESLKLMAKDLANGEKVCECVRVCVCFAYCERTKDLSCFYVSSIIPYLNVFNKHE